jgi:Uncharacterized protein conserved in bacteria (DUF2252)
MSVLTAEAPPRGSLRYQLDTGLGQPTPAERAARGKEARAAVPRDSHAVFDPGPDRPDPLTLLEEQAKARVPELVPVRWGRMMVSPFTFYRGAALPMAADLAGTPVSGLAVQARLMQAASDIFLGWQRTGAGLDGKQRDFYVRQLRDWKFSMPIEVMVPRGMRIYGELCGWTLARAHARSGDRIAIAAYLGGSDVFDQAITRFAAAYADQNERDHKALVDAVAAGRITAEPDM